MKPTNIQDQLLNALRREHIPVTVFLLSGYQLRGFVRGFDSFVLLLDCEGRQNMVYKHAISTIAPSRPVTISQDPQQPQGQPDE